MEKVTTILENIITRFSSRSFVLTVVALYFIVTHPDMTIEQIVGVLSALGFYTARTIQEDKITRE